MGKWERVNISIVHVKMQFVATHSRTTPHHWRAHRVCICAAQKVIMLGSAFSLFHHIYFVICICAARLTFGVGHANLFAASAEKSIFQFHIIGTFVVPHLERMRKHIRHIFRCCLCRFWFGDQARLNAERDSLGQNRKTRTHSMKRNTKDRCTNCIHPLHKKPTHTPPTVYNTHADSIHSFHTLTHRWTICTCNALPTPCVRVCNRHTECSTQRRVCLSHQDRHEGRAVYVLRHK